MLWIRSREARKVAKLARALAALDRQAPAVVRPQPRRAVVKLSL